MDMESMLALFSPIQPKNNCFAAALLTHPAPKEICVALRNALAGKQNKRTLGALHPLSEDLHVVIALTDHNRRESRLESLILITGALKTGNQFLGNLSCFAIVSSSS